MSHHPENSELKPYVEFQHVYKAFGDNRVLEDVSFQVFPGETLCILGRSGVGKSVSLHHIMGFLKPDSGRVIVAFEDITEATELQLEQIRKKVTMVFQNGALFDSLSVGENVAFPLRERHDLDEQQIYQIVDGLLDMVVFEERSRLATLCRLPALFTGGVERVPGVSIRQVTEAVVESDAPMVFHVDGEPVQGATRLEARVHPGVLRVAGGS